VLHFALSQRLRRAVGIECVINRHEIATQALQEVRAETMTKPELTRSARASSCSGDDCGSLGSELPDPFAAVTFHFGDATIGCMLDFSHVYAFDRVFSSQTLRALARILMASPFYVLISYRASQEWWQHGLTIVQPVAKMRLQTTGKETMNVYIYINMRRVTRSVRGNMSR
tara:strand:- start:430 stop:942 length:513 start_codon:yes stop_codon:yes gene_type:complete